MINKWQNRDSYPGPSGSCAWFSVTALDYSSYVFMYVRAERPRPHLSTGLEFICLAFKEIYCVLITYYALSLAYSKHSLLNVS